MSARAWLEGTGSRPLTYQVVGMLFLVLNAFWSILDNTGVLVVLIGFLMLAEMARTRSDRAKSGKDDSNAVINEARWIFAQIVQIHSTDHGDPLERCMELAKKGYSITRRDTSRSST